MGGRAAIRQDRQVPGILTLLGAFAGLAARAAGKPLPIRLFACLILGRAETVARRYVLDMACDLGMPMPQAYGRMAKAGTAGRGCDALACRFAELALLLEKMLAAVQWLASALAATCRDLLDRPVQPPGQTSRPSAATPPAHDTS